MSASIYDTRDTLIAIRHRKPPDGEAGFSAFECETHLPVEPPPFLRYIPSLAYYIRSPTYYCIHDGFKFLPLSTYDRWVAHYSDDVSRH